jgi:hypothetical protein
MIPKINSTKTNPISYFEYFLREVTFKAYEKSFFENPVNPSFQSNREEGYIYYLKSSYNNEEKPYVKLYFKEELKKHLLLYYNISTSLISQRKDEIENTQKNANIYLERQLSKIDVIKKSIDYFESYQPLIFSVLEKLEKVLKNYIVTEQNFTNTNHKIKKVNYSRSFFDLKEKVKISHLRKLYDLTISLDIIDDEVINEEDFITIFQSTKLPNENLKLIFNKNNRVVGYYIKEISYLFKDLTPRKIDKSQSFINKRGKLFNENDINKVNNYLESNNTKKYNYIKNEIDKILHK